jgi:hypothetical protein
VRDISERRRSGKTKKRAGKTKKRSGKKRGGPEGHLTAVAKKSWRMGTTARRAPQAQYAEARQSC